MYEDTSGWKTRLDKTTKRVERRYCNSLTSLHGVVPFRSDLQRALFFVQMELRKAASYCFGGRLPLCFFPSTKDLSIEVPSRP